MSYDVLFLPCAINLEIGRELDEIMILIYQGVTITKDRNSNDHFRVEWELDGPRKLFWIASVEGRVKGAWFRFECPVPVVADGDRRKPLVIYSSVGGFNKMWNIPITGYAVASVRPIESMIHCGHGFDVRLGKERPLEESDKNELVELLSRIIEMLKYKNGRAEDA